MKKIIVAAMITAVLLNGSSGEKQTALNSAGVQNFNVQYENDMKRDLLCLMMAYPEYINSVEKDDNGNVYVVMKSGKKLKYDDKRAKSNEEKLNNPDIQDMMEQIYYLEDINDLPEVNYDPGRIRLYPLLQEVYGGSSSGVQSGLVTVKMGYTRCQFNKRNNAAKGLKRVMEELVPLANGRRDVYSCVFPPSGTFNYRVISGTNRLSPHSFGIAIDLASNKRDYWKWAKRSEGEKRLDSYPREIVKIFEKNNFIWGGKWGHFDILHFEYRPEIIFKARYFTNEDNDKNLWYSGAPEEEDVKRYIDVIENALR